MCHRPSSTCLLLALSILSACDPSPPPETASTEPAVDPQLLAQSALERLPGIRVEIVGEPHLSREEEAESRRSLALIAEQLETYLSAAGGPSLNVVQVAWAPPWDVPLPSLSERRLTLSLGADGRLPAGALEELDFLFRDAYEAALEQRFVIDIRRYAGGEGRCGRLWNDAWYQALDERAFARALRPLERALEAYPMELHKQFFPTLLLADQVQSIEGAYGGVYSDDCMVVDTDDPASVEAIFHHEHGHFWHDIQLRYPEINFTWPFYGYIGYWDYRDGNNNPSEPSPGFVSAYAMKNEDEDVAETFEALMADPKGLVAQAEGDPVLQSKIRRVARMISRYLPEGEEVAWWTARCGFDVRSSQAWAAQAKPPLLVNGRRTPQSQSIDLTRPFVASLEHSW